MTSFTAVYEDVTARVTSEAGDVSTTISSEDLLRTVRHLAKGHYSGLGGLSKRRLAPVTREECVATREEGTKTFQGWDSINEITLSLAPGCTDNFLYARPGLLQDMWHKDTYTVQITLP